jgi:L-iditol 2-dehydrogenase
MKAAFLRKAGDLYVDFNVPMPQCAPDSVLISVREIGVCGSDLHYYAEGRIGDHVVTEPHILGHEAAGVVVEVGKRVQGFAPGDRVSIEPGVPCMSCLLCREGRYNLCDSVKFSGAPPYPGMFREYLTHDPRFLHPLPGNVSFTQGALAEPLAVAHNAVTKAGVRAGDTVLVTGAGSIGFSCIEMARVAGAARIIVSEPSEFQRSKALGIGADYAIDPVHEDVLERVRGTTDGRLCNRAIEATGVESAIMDAIRSLRKGGTAVLVGMGKALAAVPHAEVVKREVVLCGVYRYSNNFKPVIELLAAGKLTPEKWVSHRYPLENIKQAIETAGNTKADRLKVIVTISNTPLEAARRPSDDPV